MNYNLARFAIVMRQSGSFWNHELDPAGPLDLVDQTATRTYGS